MRYEKIFRTLDEQVFILREKGLTITNEDKAKAVLFKESYFFLSGYRHLLMESNHDSKFVKGSTFDELYALFLFDRHLRNIMFKNILIIETNMKSILSYVLSEKYGHDDKEYLNPKNFTQDHMKSRQVRDVLSKVKRQIRVNGKEHTATYHYIRNYGYIPLWILVKVLSFGIISELYNIMKSEDQQKVAKHYELKIETLSIYLSLLSNFRNVCAHEDILYMHRTQRSIPNTVYHRKLNIESTDDEYLFGKNDIFALIIIMKELLSKGEFRDIINEISYEVDVLEGKIKSVNFNEIINAVGLPTNWRDIIDEE
jgi:abortive infection bacteriophage resistance protein